MTPYHRSIRYDMCIFRKRRISFCDSATTLEKQRRRLVCADHTTAIPAPISARYISIQQGLGNQRCAQSSEGCNPHSTRIHTPHTNNHVRRHTTCFCCSREHSSSSSYPSSAMRSITHSRDKAEIWSKPSLTWEYKKLPLEVLCNNSIANERNNNSTITHLHEFNRSSWLSIIDG